MKADAAKARDPHRGVHAAMTAQLAVRQFGFLFLAGTALLFVCFFINYYGASFWYVWERQAMIDLKVIQLPALLVLIYGYVLLAGVLFALTPSEKSFNWFFAAMVLALILANYDHSIIDWFLGLFGGARFRTVNLVSALKIAAAGGFFLVIIAMHYNVLSDDFARRMLRRGIPTDEVAKIRPGMFKVLVPTVFTASALAFGLALLGEFSAFVFRDLGLVPKIQLILLAALVVPIAFVIRGILRDMSTERKEQKRAGGPNG